MYKVYKHTFPNNKVYIGITIQNPNERWLNGKGYHHNNYMINAIKKYGWENVKHEILFNDLTKEEAVQKEIELIAFYKSNQREYGYNIESGGNYAGSVSEETKKKISLACKGRKLSKEIIEIIANKNRGKKRSLETREKIRQAHIGRKGWHRSFEHNENMRKSLTGKKRTPEQCKRISEAHKGIKLSEEAKIKIGIASKGRIVSEETRKKISEALKGKFVSLETREKMRKRMQKKIRSVETGKIFESILDATKYNKLKSHRSICIALYDKTKTAKKQHWEFVDE